MAAIIHKRFPFGAVEILPLEGFPEGKVKIKIRPDDWVRIFIKTETGICEIIPQEKDGKWIPYFEKARNERQ
jgi:hypothetical protein